VAEGILFMMRVWQNTRIVAISYDK